MTLSVIYVSLLFPLRLDVGNRKKVEKWSEISVLNIIVLTWAFPNKFGRMESIIVDVSLLPCKVCLLVEKRCIDRLVY